MDTVMEIRQFEIADEKAVIELWRKCDLLRPWNDPHADIARKLTVNPELFLIGTVNNKIVASAMGGYEGHRGWVNYLAVHPAHQRKSYARRMMQEIENRLLAMGCPKINLQVRSGNKSALEFYSRIGFKNDDCVSLGKRLLSD